MGAAASTLPPGASLSASTAAALESLPEAAKSELLRFAATKSVPSAPPITRPTFPCDYPMRVMPWLTFEKQTQLVRSDAAADLVKILTPDSIEFSAVIFVSHAWWHRPPAPAAAAPDNPDHLKFSILLAGVRTLLEREKLDPSRVALWMDWFSIDQVDEASKAAGVRSMIHYTTKCTHMLVPVPTPTVVSGDYVDGESDPEECAAYYPEDVADYGARGWCRIEYFVFGLFFEMLEGGGGPCSRDALPLYAVGKDASELQQFKVVEFLGGDRGDMPSQGIFSFESDRASIAQLEARMISAFGHAVIENAAASGETTIDLGAKMLRDEHMPTLAKAVASGRLAAATTLSFNACPEFTYLPELTGLSSLRTLTLINCHNLARLPDLSSLPALRIVKLENCDKLVELPKLPEGVTWEESSVPEHLKAAAGQEGSE